MLCSAWCPLCLAVLTLQGGSVAGKVNFDMQLFLANMVRYALLVVHWVRVIYVYLQNCGKLEMRAASLRVWFSCFELKNDTNTVVTRRPFNVLFLLYLAIVSHKLLMFLSLLFPILPFSG